VIILPYPIEAIATTVDNAQGDAGMPLHVGELADVIRSAIHDAGYRLVPLCALPSEAHARGSDPSTSHDAGRSVCNLNAKHEAVRQVLRHKGAMTDEEMIEMYNHYRLMRYVSLADVGLADPPHQSDASLRTRRAELVAAGKVRATGETRPTRSGRQAQVWEVVPSHLTVPADEVTVLAEAPRVRPS